MGLHGQREVEVRASSREARERFAIRSARCHGGIFAEAPYRASLAPTTRWAGCRRAAADVDDELHGAAGCAERGAPRELFILLGFLARNWDSAWGALRCACAEARAVLRHLPEERRYQPEYAYDASYSAGALYRVTGWPHTDGEI